MSRKEEPWDHPPKLTPADLEDVPRGRAVYCQLAHLPFEPAQPVRPEGVVGREHLKALLKDAGVDLVTIFNKDKAQAFLAVREGHFAVLAFRGTQGDKELRDVDGNFGRVPLPGGPGITVHGGFLQAFTSCREEIEAAVDDTVPATLGLYITGHSLGGALAQLASVALDRANLWGCYTFGSPRVGTSGFASLVKCPNYRIVNNWDLVPGLPLPWRRRYRHAGEARLLVPGTREAVVFDNWNAGFLGQQ
jgi:hypothetical protein